MNLIIGEKETYPLKYKYKGLFRIAMGKMKH